MKKCSPMRYKYTSTRITKIKKAENIKFWRRWGATVILMHCWWQWATNHFGDRAVRFFKKLSNMTQQYDSVIYPRKVKTDIYKECYRRMIIAALLIIASNLESAQVPINNRRMDTCKVIVFNNKKEQTSETCINMDKSQKHFALHNERSLTQKVCPVLLHLYELL